MPIRINPQLNLPIELVETDKLMSETTRAELVEELANLIFLFCETAIDKPIVSEDKINE